MIWQWCEHTSLWISIADWFWTVEKWITVHTSQDTITCNGSTIFNTVFCIFLWSDCYVIFTVLLKTKKLYLPAISSWSIHKMPREKIRKLTFKMTLNSKKSVLNFLQFPQSFVAFSYYYLQLLGCTRTVKLESQSNWDSPQLRVLDDATHMGIFELQRLADPATLKPCDSASQLHNQVVSQSLGWMLIHFSI